jgi:Domain of unknown function (DUF4159)
MHRIRTIAVCLIPALVLASAQPALSAEPLADKVKSSLDKGIGYLKKRQENRGGEWNWENSELLNQAWSGGTSCLATLALLTAGVNPTEREIQRAMPYIRSLKPTQTYVVALQAMVLAEIGEAKDLNIIQNDVDFLLKSRMRPGGELMGWSYGMEGHVDADNSNTQYALLGLLAGRQAGAKIDQKDWEEIQRFYIRTQIKVEPRSGGWPYRPTSHGTEMRDGPSHSMTCAGLSGLFIASVELNSNKQEFDPATGIAQKCGLYEENDAVAKGMNWLARNFKFEMAGEMHRATFYNVYGIERVGRLSGQRFIGEHDWYREGCELLCGVKPSDLHQADDGSWRMGAGIDNMPVISTSFALLFLSKGRTPILISKLAFDGMDNNKLDWNHKHSDARHLVEYASKNLFKKQPLAWQIFDPRLADIEKEDRFNEELSNLLQSPVLYMTGHAAPNLTPRQIELLRRYIDEGGFIFAEACCGSKAFAEGFRKLMDKVFNRESQLITLRPEHPIWSAHIPLDPAEFIRGRPTEELIQCIERGCKTVVVFSPQPMAGYWEDSKFMPQNNKEATARGELTYQFAGNVIAYATGLEMPKPRLTKVELTDRTEEKNVPRSEMVLAQLRHDGDWHPAPQALRNLAAYLRGHFQLDVALTKEEVRPSDTNLPQYKFMYMHGRRQFTIEDEEVRNIRNNLLTGATLFGDACCGASEYDKAFRDLVSKLYPDKKLERIPLDDYLYSEKLNGRAITSVKCRKGEAASVSEYTDMPPELEGVKVGNRWVIIYSKFDIGCALEKSKSSACKGHDHESAQILAAAAVLYSLKR